MDCRTRRIGVRTTRTSLVGLTGLSVGHRGGGPQRGFGGADVERWPSMLPFWSFGDNKMRGKKDQKNGKKKKGKEDVL